MPICRPPGALIYFAHIPKTGGSSVEAYLARKGPLAFHTPRTPCGSLNVTAQHIPRSDARDLFPDEIFDNRFAVLRDPMARLKSEYRWRVSKAGYRRGVFGVGGGHFIRAGRKRCPLDFDTWAIRVLDAAAKDPTVHDNHIRPQADFVAGDEMLFAFENGLTPVFRWIDEITGTGPERERFWVKRSSRTEIVEAPETRARVEAFYARDYEMHARILDGSRAA